MRILLTSDLHGDSVKLAWLRDNAPKHDALLVAGDHLDIFTNLNAPAQQKRALFWAEEILKSGRSLAWSSGNHDFFEGEDSPLDEASPRWMREVPVSKRYVTDGESRMLPAGSGTLVVTTIPWPVTGNAVALKSGGSMNFQDYVASLIRKGRELRRKHGAPWLVLMHEPPIDTALAIDCHTTEAAFTRQIIELAQPDFSVHGHIHEAPFREGGSWRAQLGETTCFNAGQSPTGELPHYILLDWRTGTDPVVRWWGGDREDLRRWNEPEWE